MGAGASSDASQTIAPLHHIALGGLTGLTHGTERHVTWSLYSEAGYHTIHLQHDGLTGRRLVQFDQHVIYTKKFFYALFDTSSTHSFYVKDRRAIQPKEVQAMNDRVTAADNSYITVNITEKETYFLYTCAINGIQYRHYQGQFWARAIIYTVPRLSMKSRRNRHVEDGVREECHSVVIIHRPTLVVLVDGEPQPVQSTFTSDDGFEVQFALEDGLNATYVLTPYSGSATINDSHQHNKGIQYEGNSGLYKYELTVNDEPIMPMPRPPLLPASWAPDAQANKPAQDARLKATEKVKEEEKTTDEDAPNNGLLAAATDLATKQRRISEIDFNLGKGRPAA